MKTIIQLTIIIQHILIIYSALNKKNYPTNRVKGNTPNSIMIIQYASFMYNGLRVLSSREQKWIKFTDTARLRATPGAVTFTKSGCRADQNERRGTAEGDLWLVDETPSLSETPD